MAVALVLFLEIILTMAAWRLCYKQEEFNPDK